VSRWKAFYEHAGRDPHETLVQAADGFEKPGLAVDLGCGAGRDTVELLRRGWRVIAIDGDAGGIELLRERVGAEPRLQAEVMRIEDARWPPVELVNAGFSLPFCERAAFPHVWDRIVGSLRPGGRFAGHLLGPHDSWAERTTTHARADVEALLAPFAVERLDEVEHDGQTVTGTAKHWHVFHLVAERL